MLAKVCSAALAGIDAYPIEVEVNAGFGDTLVVIVVPIYPHQIHCSDIPQIHSKLSFVGPTLPDPSTTLEKERRRSE